MKPELASHGFQTAVDSSHIFLMLENAKVEKI